MKRFTKFFERINIKLKKIPNLRINNISIKIEYYSRNLVIRKILNYFSKTENKNITNASKAQLYINDLIKLDSDEDIKFLIKQLTLIIIYTVSRQFELRDELHDDILKTLSRVDYKMLNERQWYILYYVLLSLTGRFEISNIFRINHKKIALDYYKRKISSLNVFQTWILFKALMDDGKLSKASNIIQFLENNKKRKFIPLYDMKNYLSLFKLNSEKGFKNDWNTHKYNKYKKYIKGKSVALVGPAYSSKRLGKEIDSYDVIIRLNEFNSENSNNYVKKNGKKTNVVYIYLNRSIKDVKFKGLKPDFIIKNKETKSRYIRFDYLYKGSILNMYNFDFAYIGGFNFVQRVLLDLLRYQPKNIKVFKTTFYLGYRTYENVYRFGKKNNSQMWHQFAWHDQISQINLFRNLLSQSVIHLEDEVLKIISLTDNEIATKLQKKFQITI